MARRAGVERPANLVLVDRDSGLLATLAAGVLFGTSIPMIKLGLDHNLPPLSFAASRFLLASGLILVFLGRRGWVDRSLFSSRMLWTVGLFNAVGYVLQFEGQLLTTGSEAALIIGTAALMIPLMSWAKRQEVFVPLKATGVVLGFLGVGLLVTGRPDLSGASGLSRVIGDILLFATAITIALVFVYAKSMAVAHGDRSVTGGIVLSTSLLLLPFAPIGFSDHSFLDPIAWTAIVFLALFGTVGAYYFFSRGLERVSPTVSSIILPIEVIVSTLLSVVLFNESFTLLSGLGGVLIVLGVVLVSVNRHS